MRKTIKKIITRGFLLFLFTFFSIGVQGQHNEYGGGNTDGYNDGFVSSYHTGGTYINGVNEYGVQRTIIGNGANTYFTDGNGVLHIVGNHVYSYGYLKKQDTTPGWNPYAGALDPSVVGPVGGGVAPKPPCTLQESYCFTIGRILVNCACVVKPCAITSCPAGSTLKNCECVIDCVKKISKAHLLEQSSKYGIPKEAALAIYDVETQGKPFRQNGNPKVLFERHRFSSLTNGQYDSSNPGISNPIKGGYGTENSQLTRLQEAYALNPSAAIKSASYGGFQIMGSNYKLAGYSDMTKFYNDMTSTNVDLHLDAFFEFAKNKGLINDINNQNWDAVAKGYNGKAYNSPNSYSKNYDIKIRDAFNKYKNNPSLISAKDCLP